MTDLKELDRELAAILLETVQRREFNVTYKEVAARLSQRIGRKVNPHFGLANALGAVSICCFELGLPLISAIVRYSGASNNISAVGEGFYPLACELKPKYREMDPIAVWKAELNQVRQCTEWSRLSDYLSGKSEVAPQIKAPAVKNQPFYQWLSSTSKLAESSIGKYAGAVGTISRDMLSLGVIAKPLEDMSIFELDRAISSILNNTSFMDKNSRGNHMYSNALKQYRYFMKSTCGTRGLSDAVATVEQDKTLSVTERQAIVQARIGQGEFRKALMDKYHGACVITGIDLPQLLVASHIKPWSVSDNSERLSASNGLLLSATYDRLFDNGLITFDRTGQIYLSNAIGTDNLKRLRLEKGMRFDLGICGNMLEFLEYHNDVVFVK